MGIVLVLGGIKLVDISIDIVDIFCLCAESCICSVGIKLGSYSHYDGL